MIHLQNTINLQNESALMQTSLAWIAFNIVSKMLELFLITHDPIIIFVLPNYFLRPASALYLFPGEAFPGMQDL